jgi:flagellar hook-basal body complex protein FliE
MDIQAISAITPSITSSLATIGAATGAATPASNAVGVTGATGPDFGRMLGNVLNTLAGSERTTTDLVTRAAAGEAVDLHDVMIATQVESLNFQVALQVRNKLVEAYQEVFRMQM